MSFLPISSLNLNYYEILINATTISAVDSTVILHSGSGNSTKVSLSGNSIVLQPNSDYFIYTSININTAATLGSTSTTTYPTIKRLAFYNVTNSVWLPQKALIPNQANSGTAGFAHQNVVETQSFCLIPSSASVRNIQLRTKTGTGTTVIYKDEATYNMPNSTIMIYHN